MASKVIGSVSMITRFMLRNHKNLPNGCCQCLDNGSGNSIFRAFATVRTPLLSTLAKSFSTNIVQQCSVSKIEDEPDELYKRLTIEVKGHDRAVLKSYGKFLNMTSRELGITVESQQVPKKHVKRYTLLKSVHIYKKHRVQYETRTYFHIMKIKHVTGSTADAFLEYIQRNLPEGVAMKVTRERLESLPSHLSSVPSAASQSVS